MNIGGPNGQEAMRAEVKALRAENAALRARVAAADAAAAILREPMPKGRKAGTQKARLGEYASRLTRCYVLLVDGQ